MSNEKIVAAKNERVRELRELNMEQWRERCTVRDVMNNRNAMQALLGSTIKDPSMRLPIANLMQRAATVLGQKLGRRPDVKVDPPVSSDSDLAKKRADKRARVVEWLDDETDLESLLPQVGRWVPGYSFTLGVLRQDYRHSRQPVPVIELRDPIQTFPGAWGAKQQPLDVAVGYVIPRTTLAQMYPQYKATLLGKQYAPAPGGGILLDGRVAGGSPGWMNQSGAGVEVYEYYDERGCWWLAPQHNLLLEYVPNVLKDDTSFRLLKKFSFDELVGQYDSAIGLMAYQARLALLASIATEDAVMAETIIIGDLKGDEYRRGRNSVNHLTPGSTVQKMNSRVPFESFTMIDRTERQLRLIMGHSSQNDGESDLSFATGRGLQELAATGAVELREYQDIFKRWVRSLDRMRLEWLETVSKDTEFLMNGVREGAPFAEKMIPANDIKGDYTTRRVYGAMAGFDDATKIITGLQLLQGKIIDRTTLREQLDGLENHSKIEERIRAEEAEEVAMELLRGMASQGDPKAASILAKVMPAGVMKKAFEELTAAEGEAVEEPAVAPAGMPPDVTTVMSRLTESGGSGGLQTVGRVA